MEKVQFARPILDSVEYFIKNDPYTYRHILMVFAFSILLSKELVPDYRVRIREAATGPLHDFGKVCVPVEILRKTTPLTRDERKTWNIIPWQGISSSAITRRRSGILPPASPEITMRNETARDIPGHQSE